MNILTHQGTHQGTFSGGPAHPQNLPKIVVASQVDRDLLDTLAQPTAYEKAIRRRMALTRLVLHSSDLAKYRLGGDAFLADQCGVLIEKYQALYNFTQEEVDAYIAKTNSAA